MAETVNSQNSLQELATLLSYLYDHYIKRNSLVDGLVAFMGDIGLLGNLITVIEIENIRRNIQKSNRSTQHQEEKQENDMIMMSYEQFYLWLRGIACCLYYQQLKCPKKSLHKLLVEKIIPFGSNWGVFVFSDSLKNTINYAILEGVLHFQEFFRLWFVDLTLQRHRMIPLSSQWNDIVEHNSSITMESLLRHFEEIGLVPHKLNSLDLQSFMQQVAITSSTLSQDHNLNLKFSDFLLIIGFIASSISLYEHSMSTHSYYHSGLHLLVQSISEYLLGSALQRWIDQTGMNYPHRSQKKQTTQERNQMNQISPSFFPANTILLICRQGAVIQKFQDFSTILDILSSSIPAAFQSKSTSLQTNEVTPIMIPMSRIPHILSTIARRCSLPQSQSHSQRVINEHSNRQSQSKKKKSSSNSVIFNTDSTDKYLSALVGGSELASDALSLAASFPRVLFASSKLSISILQNLYSIDSLRLLQNDVMSPLFRIMETLQQKNLNALSTSNIKSGEDVSGESDLFVNFTAPSFSNEGSKLFPLNKILHLLADLGDENKILSSINYILSPQMNSLMTSISSSSSTSSSSLIDLQDSSLTEIQLIEVLYGVAQILFGGIGETYCPNPEGFVLQRNHLNLRPSEVVWTMTSNLSTSTSFSRPLIISIKDELDRFICLLLLVDPLQKNKDPLHRLNIQHQDNLVSSSTPSFRHIERDDHQMSSSSLLPSSSSALLPSQTAQVSTIEFSSHFGYLFTRFFTLANLHYFESVQIGLQPLRRFEMTLIQKSFLLLLLLFPVNDFAYSPWDLADLISQFSNARNDNTYLVDSDSNFSNVQLDLRHILLRYQISGSYFESYLQHILEKTKLSNSNYLASLQDSSRMPEMEILTQSSSCLLEYFFSWIPFLFSETNRVLLKEGNFLCIWEFLRCLRGNNRNDFTTQRAYDSGFEIKSNPFMEQFHSPFPTRYLFEMKRSESGISWKAASQWALLHRIDCIICLKWYRVLLQISGTVGLHYSSFILFAIFCFVEMRVQSLQSTLQAINEDIVTQAIKSFYQNVTSQIQLFQRSSPQCLFPIILEANTNPSFRKDYIESIIDATIERNTALAHSLPPLPSFPPQQGKRNQEKKLQISKNSKFTNSIPTRPESSLWDAPRWLQYCKLIGLTELVASFPHLWSVYRVCLRDALPPQEIEKWDETVVPPTPIQINSSIILRCLDHIDMNSKSLNTILAAHPIPYLASLIDDSTIPSDFLPSSPPTSSLKEGHATLFEDLFRVGGSRLIAAIESSSTWFQELYYALAEPSLIISSTTDLIEQTSSEPLLTTVCRYLSSSKFFSLGSVSILVKQCFGFRTRFNCAIESNFITLDLSSAASFAQTTSTRATKSGTLPFNDYEVSLSFLEFEELILRCAHQLWERAGLSTPKDQEWLGIGLFESVKSLSPNASDEMISKYCNECRRSLSNYQSDQVVVKHLQSSKRTIQGGKTWGVDYLSPFCEILQQLETPINKSKEKLQLVAKDLEDIQKKTTKDSSNLIIPTPNKRDILPTPDVRPHLFRQLEEMKTAKAALLQDDNERRVAEENLKSVVVRSEELVATILAKRDEYDFLSSISHAPSPPPVVKEQTRTQLSPASQRVATFQSKDRLYKRQERMAELAELREKQREETTPSPQELRNPLQTPNRRKKGSRSVKPSSPTTSMKLLIDNSLFIGIQEALWPVFATYCSCGDSTDPGKLSGPNLFTLLSKLDILTNHTTLSDIGILLHQISAHSLSLSPFISTISSDLSSSQQNSSSSSSPLLSFEEFIIFLCAFSELRYEGVVHLPNFINSTTATSSSASSSFNEPFDQDQWLRLWNGYFSNSKSFSSLFHDCILPVVNQSFLLASPDDARDRDGYSLLFSLDVLFSIETVEKEMLQLYSSTRTSSFLISSSASPSSNSLSSSSSSHPHFDHMYTRMVEIFQVIKLIPQVITEKEVKKLFLDIIPASYRSHNQERGSSSLQFPQWEWVSCVVAYQAVMHSLEKNNSNDKMKNLSSLVSEVLTAMVNAMTSSLAKERGER